VILFLNSFRFSFSNSHIYYISGLFIWFEFHCLRTIVIEIWLSKKINISNQ
jgi:hypothetical protein